MGVKTEGCWAAMEERGGRKKREMGGLNGEGEETWIERYKRRRRLRCFSWVSRGGNNQERLLMEGKGLFQRSDLGRFYGMN